MPLGPKSALTQMSPGTWPAFNRYLYISVKQNSGERFKLVHRQNIRWQTGQCSVKHNRMWWETVGVFTSLLFLKGGVKQGTADGKLKYPPLPGAGGFGHSYKVRTGALDNEERSQITLFPIT